MPTEHSLSQEKYMGARGMALLPLWYGERGVAAVHAYKYFRWVDDTVDEQSLPRREKLLFLDSQKQLIIGSRGPENDSENGFCTLPWSIFYNNESQIRSRSLVLISSIEEDVSHQGLIPRTYIEIRHNFWKSTLAAIENLGLVLNQKPVHATREFVNLIYDWHYLGSLYDFKEDVDQQMLEVGFSKDEKQKILKEPNLHKRRGLVLEIYNQERFDGEVKVHLNSLIKLTPTIMKLDIPLWQKTLAFSYMRLREPHKLGKITYPFDISTPVLTHSIESSLI